jgi:nitrite reductase/ring-hydroxylating ferredoxin subunit
MRRALALVIIAVFFFSCGKNADPIPNVAVNLELPLTDPRLSALNTPGGLVLINGYGVAGLILYHSPFGGYVAYDRCSSYKPENKCAVTPDAGDLTATDPCSGSVFSLTDGTPQKPPATTSLKSYYVTVSNYEIFVSN